MKKSNYKVSPETKEQILKRIKEDGISVFQAAKDHCLATNTIYRWLTRGVTRQVSWAEYNKLKKENQDLKTFIGEITVELSKPKKKELVMGSQAENKAALARELGISRSSLYCRAKQPDKDWELKCEIEKVLREHPAYGHKRLAIHLKINKKRIIRVMKMFGIKPCRKRGKKWRKGRQKDGFVFPNLLIATFPAFPNQLVVNALLNAVKHPVPAIAHSDQGSEYTSADYTTLWTNLNIRQLMNNPGCPWGINRLFRF